MGGHTAMASTLAEPRGSVIGARPSARSRAPRPRRACATRAVSVSTDKFVWIETTNCDVLKTSLESGLTTSALFPPENAHLAETWRAVGRFEAIRVDDAGVVHRIPSDARGALDDDSHGDSETSPSSRAVGVVCPVAGPEDVDAVARLAGVEPLVIVDSSAWRVIPAENLVAAYGAAPDSTLVAFARDADDAAAMFEALETGVDGVVLRTDDPNEARELAKYMRRRKDHTLNGLAPRPDPSPSASSDAGSSGLERAVVTRVEVVGVGDRACVDCASAFAPGEGLLVGSFARGLFLVHSECLDAHGYVNARPFRVNAGPLCSYVMKPGGETAYLSELAAGDEVLCVGPRGETRVALIGRVKVEQRQMVLVEAVAEDGETFAALLQNAETVRLVRDEGGNATAVSSLEIGDAVLVHRTEGARHTGLKIEEERWYET